MFSQDSEIPVPKYDREFKYSIKRDINTINFFDIDDLINVFISDFEFFKKCYLLSRKVPKEYESKLENFFNNLKNNTIRDFDFDLNQDGVLGISKSILDDSKITLTINPKLWSVSSTPKRLYVLYHELGHDVLNFKHGQGGKMMFTLSQSDYTLNEFYNDRGYMFFKFFEDFFKNIGYDKLLIIQNGGCFLSHYSYNEKNGMYYYLGKPFTGTQITDWSLYYNSENNNIEYQEIKQGRPNGKYSKTTNEGQVLETGNYIQKFISGDEYPYVQYPVGKWFYYDDEEIKETYDYLEIDGNNYEYNSYTKNIVTFKRIVKNGETIKSINYEKDGITKINEFFFEDGIGIEKVYHKNGNLWMTHYVNDSNLTFRGEFYDVNGSLNKIIEYDGNPPTKYYYDKNGQEEKEKQEIYINGEWLKKQ